jgi:hypothetical protein
VAGPFFELGALDREIEKKLASLETPAEELAEELVELVPPPGRLRVRELWTALASLSFDHLYPNYLAHPVRVAGSWLHLRPDLGYAEVALALCHNVREAGVAGSVPLPPELRRAVDVLTIDRARERDEAYLDAFYDRLASEGLIVLKGLDKLDNALDWVRHDVEAYDVRVVLEHVCPRLEREEPALADYLRGLTRYVVSGAAKERFAPAP